MDETENIKKNWKAGWFPIEKVADRMVEPKHPAYRQVLVFVFIFQI